MREKCKKKGAGQPRKVRQLMGSKKETRAVLEFIAAT